MSKAIEQEVRPLRILVTGATGYVGGRLTHRLLAAGYRVRLLVRGGSDRLKGRPWRDQVEIVNGDVLHPDSLGSARQSLWRLFWDRRQAWVAVL